MHLLPVYYNNINSKKKKPFRKPGWQKAQAEHDKWLRSMGAHPDQIKSKPKSSGLKVPNYKTERQVETSNYVGKITSKKTANEYTGDFITGIATMHKSNMVPVNKNTKGSDYATMRRN